MIKSDNKERYRLQWHQQSLLRISKVMNSSLVITGKFLNHSYSLKVSILYLIRFLLIYRGDIPKSAMTAFKGQVSLIYYSHNFIKYLINSYFPLSLIDYSSKNNRTSSYSKYWKNNIYLYKTFKSLFNCSM